MANRAVVMLTDRQAKLAKKTVAVGGVKGLVLRVRDTQAGLSKTFMLRMKIDGKDQYQSIGPYPEVSLEEARQIALDWRNKMKKGVRGSEIAIAERKEKMEARETKKTYSVQQMLFDYLEFGKDRNWFDTSIKDKKISRSHHEIVLGYMKNHIPKSILLMPVKDLTPELLAETFKEKWLTMVDTPERVIGEISRAFDHAVKAEKINDGMKNPADLNGKLRILLPPDHLRAKKGHHAALHPDRIPELFEELSRHTGVTAKLAMYSILTASRSTNARLMVWPEVHLDPKENIDAPIHVVPRDEMKVKKRTIEFDRETPLSREAVKVLNSVPRYQAVSKHDFVFSVVGREGITAISAAAVAILIRKINYERKKKGMEPFVDPNILRDGEPVSITLHGTARASFETWAYDSVRYNHKQFSVTSIEHCLDHVTAKYNNAYLRRAVIGEMREIFEAWGEYCFSLIEK